jgi:hypothetical protein
MQGLFGILYTKCAALYKNKKEVEPCTEALFTLRPRAPVPWL